MKVLLCLTIIIAVAVAENCHRTSDCTLTQCNADLTLSCFDHYCTCMSDYSCSHSSDCDNLDPCNQGRSWVCYGGSCHCSRWGK